MDWVTFHIESSSNVIKVCFMGTNFMLLRLQNSIEVDPSQSNGFRVA